MKEGWYAIPNCTPDGCSVFVDKAAIVVSGAPDVIQQSEVLRVYSKGHNGIQRIKLRYADKIIFMLHLPWIGSAWLEWLKRYR